MSIRSRVCRFELAPWLNHSGAGPSSRIDGKASLFTTESHTPPSRQDLAVAYRYISKMQNGGDNTRTAQGTLSLMKNSISSH
jgi:hypothetical protein